jgi:hypothetical protein
MENLIRVNPRAYRSTTSFDELESPKIVNSSMTYIPDLIYVGQEIKTNFLVLYKNTATLRDNSKIGHLAHV